MLLLFSTNYCKVTDELTLPFSVELSICYWIVCKCDI